MPIRSKKQWRWMWKFKPRMAKKWAAETKQSYKSLPTRVRKKKKVKRAKTMRISRRRKH